jgi:ankyrin repeat protein
MSDGEDERFESNIPGGWTGLHKAAKEDDVKMAEDAVKNGDSLNAGLELSSGDGDCLGDTPLHTAARWNGANVARWLLQDTMVDVDAVN